MNQTNNKIKNCIVDLAMPPLDGQIRRKQQIAKHLSEGRRVLLVDGAVSLFSLLKRNARRETWNRLMRLFSLKAESDNLLVYTAIPALPGENKSLIIRLFNIKIKLFWLRFIVVKVAKKYGFLKPVVIVYEPWLFPAAKTFNPSGLVYDCIDDHAGLVSTRHEKTKLEELTKKLAQKADLIIAVNPDLKQKLKKYSNNIHVLRHGVDLNIFDFKQCSKGDVYRKRYLPGIDKSTNIIVYIGRIDTLRLDVPLLKKAISSSDSIFLFVGSKDLTNEEDKIFNLPNVRYIPQLSQQEIAKILAFADVGIIPFKANDTMRHIRSLKVMEYFAMGLPVVTTALDALLDLKPHVYVTEAPDNFLAQIKNALEERKNSNLRKERIAIAEKHSWQKIAGQFNELINEAIVP